MHQKIRQSSVLNIMRGSSTFNELVRNYRVDNRNLSSNLLTNRLKDLLKHFKPTDKIIDSDTKTFGEKAEILNNSKYMHYLFDSIMYYRMRRVSFVQTIDQFEFLARFGNILTINMIKKHLSPTVSDLIDLKQLEQNNEFLNPMKKDKIKNNIENQNPKTQSIVKVKEQTLTKSPIKVQKSESKEQSISPKKESQKIPVKKEEIKNTPKEVGGITMSDELKKKLQKNLAKQSSSHDKVLI